MMYFEEMHYVFQELVAALVAAPGKNGVGVMWCGVVWCGVTI